MVVPRCGVDPRTGDREDRDSPPVRAAHLDRAQLAAAHEPEGPEEEVVRLKHWVLPYGLREERWVSLLPGSR